MPVAPDVSECVATWVQNWLHEKAWPIWSTQGVDHEFGGFFEALDKDALPVPLSEKRTRTTARQIYCFSQAALLGFEPAADIAEKGWEFLTRTSKRADGGWVFSVTHDGAVKNSNFKLYEAAFVLFAHCWYFRLTQSQKVLASAKNTVRTIDRHLSDANMAGWYSDETRANTRHQNPHMHLLEAALELAKTTKQSIFYDLATRVLTLAQDRFFSHQTGALAEVFDIDWHPLPQAEVQVEPGHMMEWVWLFERAANVLGERSLLRRSERIYDFAFHNGGAAETGLLYDMIDTQGLVTRQDIRIWPQTEHLKACVAMGRSHATEPYRSRARKIVTLIDESFFSDVRSGLWKETIPSDSTIEPQYSRGTSLYHIQLGFTEFLGISS